jgi:hypothetical protein
MRDVASEFAATNASWTLESGRTQDRFFTMPTTGDKSEVKPTSNARPANAMLLLTFMTDFAKIALATDQVRSSRKPETWNIGGFITVAVILGVAMVAESLLFLWICWSRFGLATNDNALYRFSFLMLRYFAVFSVVSARERRAFWSTMPSKALTAALMADAPTGTILTRVGLPRFMPLPWPQRLAIFIYAMVSCLIVNDALKVVMMRWRVPTAIA